MAEKGAIVEFDFTVLNGAEILCDTAKRFLAELDGIGLDAPTEARFLAGATYFDGLSRLFEAVKTKKTALKAARDLADAFNARVTELLPTAISQGFRNFAMTLADAGVKVVVATRADICSDDVRNAFGDLLGDGVALFQDTSSGYGSTPWESWRLAGRQNGLRNTSAIAVTGSGYGVKSALRCGMGSLAVVNDHVAYQDFGGADEIVAALDTAAAKKALSLLHVSS